MKKLYTLILLFNICFAFSQENDSKISLLLLENATMEEVIKSIEEKTNYHFYYIEDWLTDDLISVNYKDASIQKILDDLFKDTLVNYYVSKDFKVILTKYNIIYESLPNGFFNEEKSISTETETAPINSPVFVNDENVTEVKKIETIRIGRESKNSSQKQFTLRGIITNKVDGKPISDLALIANGQKIGAVTNEKGLYVIKLPIGINTIETRSLAFEEIIIRVIIYNDGQFNFSINESYEGLDEVIIKTNVEKNIEEVIAGKTEINVKQVKNIPLVLGERDIFKVALSLPGISTAGEGASGYNVRGGKTDQNLILLDDAVIYNPIHFFGIFSAINPFTTGEFDIYKGNIPAKYGGRLSSVFDIKTKDANIEKISGEASIGPVTGNLSLEIPIVKGKSGLLIGGRATYSDWILRSLDDEELKNSQASYYDVIAKYNHKFDENNELKASGYFSNDKYSITSDSLYNYNNRLASIKWNHKFNEKNSGDLILSNSNYKFDIDYDGNANNDFNLNYNIDEIELKLNMLYSPNKKHTINYGIASKLYNVEPGNVRPEGSESIIDPLTIPTERALESGLFLSDNFTITEKLSVYAGLRYSVYMYLGESTQRLYESGMPKNETTLIGTQEYSKNEVVKTYTGPEIRLSARYLIKPDLAVKASYNSLYQYIHSLSNNTTASPIDTWKLSDLNIKPQDAKQFSLGVFKNFNDNLYELSIEGYYKKMNNVLDYKVGAQLLLNETIEQELLQGDGKSYGIEFLLRKNYGKLNGWLGYTYSRSFTRLDGDFAEEIVNDGEYFPSNYDKPHDISLVANYKLTQRFSLSSNFVYQTGRPVTVPVGNYVFNGAEYVLYSDRNEYRIPDYFRLDIGVNIEGNHKLKKLAHSFWNISIYNVLGRNNPYSVYFVTDNGEVKAYQTSIFSIPIPTITYNIKF